MILTTIPRRSGFTLLELLLATVIGSMILSGLYIVMNMTMTQTQASRDAADAESTSRAVFNKISLDLASVLGPAPPKSGGTPASGSTTSATTTSTTSTAGAGTGTGTGTPSDVSSASDTQSDTSSDASQTTQNFPFQVGVLGTGTQLSIFASRVPTILSTPGALAQQSDGTQQASDLVRIDYWKGTGGLCRQERPWITADQTGNSFSFDLSNEATSLIADDATDVLFEYYDGSSWVQTWEGGSGTIPTPPVAIRVTLTFSRPNSGSGSPITRTVTQTIAVRTAPGSTVPELIDPVIASDSTTDQSDMSSTAAGGGSSTTGGGTSTAGGGASAAGGGGSASKGGGGAAAGGGSAAAGGGAKGGGASAGGAKGGGK